MARPAPPSAPAPDDPQPQSRYRIGWLANYTGLSLPATNRALREGRLPAADVVISRRVRWWSGSTLLAWIAAQKARANGPGKGRRPRAD